MKCPECKQPMEKDYLAYYDEYRYYIWICERCGTRSTQFAERL